MRSVSITARGMSVVDARMCSTLFITATLVTVLTVGPAFAKGGPLPDSSAYQYSQPIEPTFSDIPYATLSPSEKFDLYLPAARDRPAPLIIWIHGGAFSVGDKRSMPRCNFGPPPKPIYRMGPYQIQVPDVTALTGKGYSVVSLNYRLLRHPGDTFVAYALPAVQAAVIWYGAIESDSFPPEIRISHYISEAKTIPPILIGNGDADNSVPVASAIRLNEELLKKGAKSSLTIVPGAGHEDPAFMATQMLPTFTFLDATFDR